MLAFPMRELLSKHVIKVFAEDRWSDVSPRAMASFPSHCVVLEKPRGRFLGVVRVKERIEKPAERIFADLISVIPVVRVGRNEGSAHVIELFRQSSVEDAVVLSPAGRYVGLVTRKSLADWRRQRLTPPSGLRSVNRPIPATNGDERSVPSALENAFAQLDELSYAISHELRTPLRAMRGYALALQEDFGPQLEGAGRDYIQRILRASQRLERLSKGVLSYAQIARAPLTLRRCDLNKITEAALQEIGCEKSADVRIAPSLGEAVADRPLLIRCVAELLKNAYQFAAPGQLPKILIGSEVEGLDRRLWVEDEGVGIRPEHHQRIFQLFEQVRLGLEDDHIGVGLAMVRQAIERMGGRVGVQSQGSGGARFWISLPR